MLAVIPVAPNFLPTGVVRPDLDPNCLTLTLMVLLKEFFKKVDFEKKKTGDKKNAKLPSMQRVNPYGFPHTD